MLLLSADGLEVESYGDVAQSQIDNEKVRERIRDYFKPCIGAHLEDTPQPHQLRYTHAQALEFTRLTLDAVLAQLVKEKWRTGSFDERLIFTFAFPVHWQTDHGGVIFDDFSGMVRGCLPEDLQENVRFVSEPEGAILSLQRHGHLQQMRSGQATLIIDVGGSTTDMVAGEVDPSTGELLFIGRYGEPFGGGHYDVEIAKSISDELLIPASAVADDPGALLSIRNVAKRLKESLSRQLLFDSDAAHVPQRTVTLVMRDGEIYRGVVKLDEARFQDITEDLSSRFDTLIEKGLDAINLHNEEIGQVVLVGGGAKLFSIYQSLKIRFAGVDLILADNPDESVVRGISLEYGAATYKSRPSLLFMPDFELVSKEAPPAEVGGFRLVSLDGDSYELAMGENHLGRAPTNDIHIEGEKISRYHAKLVVGDDGVEALDLGSTNGTFIDDTRLEKDQPVDVQEDNEIRFGDKRFRLEKVS